MRNFPTRLAPIFLFFPGSVVAGCSDTELPPFPGQRTNPTAGMGQAGAVTSTLGGSLDFGGAASGGLQSIAGSANGGASGRVGSNDAAGNGGIAGSVSSAANAGSGGTAGYGGTHGEGGTQTTLGTSLLGGGGGGSAVGGANRGDGGSFASGAAGNGGTLGISGNAGSPEGGTVQGGAQTGGFPNGGTQAGGVATGGVATGGVATGGVATGGVATGGVATGGVATGGAPTCESAPTIKPCDGKCVDVSSDPRNCRACGHDCGYGSSCSAGECQPVQVHGNALAITEFEVDDTSILFSPPGIQACSTVGCALGPSPVSNYSPGSERFLANGYVLVRIPNVGATGRYTGYGLCPTSGCTTSNMIGFGETNQQVSIHTLSASAHNFYQAITAPPGSGISTCQRPTSAGCTSSGGGWGFTTSSMMVSDTAVFFTANIGGTGATLYACSVAELSSCTPAAVNLPSTLTPVPRAMAAYANDLYFYQPGGAPPNTNPTLRKCPRTGCGSTGGTSLGVVSGSMDEMEVDSTGVYWIQGSSIQMCPLSGCVGAPRQVAAGIGSATMLRLNTGFVYWVNTSSNAIYRVAKPVL